jgi:DNA-binding GntR family transcriptional regulator
MHGHAPGLRRANVAATSTRNAAPLNRFRQLNICMRTSSGIPLMDRNDRARWIEAYRQSGNAGRVCTEFGISRPTLRKWLRRYEELGPDGLHEENRRPLHSPNRKVFAREEALILDLRRTRKLGVQKLRQELRDEHGVDLSSDTILKVLRRAGEPSRRRRRTAPPPEAGNPVMGDPAEMPGNGFHGISPDDHIATAIAELITHGRFRPGQKLSEQALAARLGVGRTQIREALRRLSAGGLVVLERNRGAFVADPSLSEVRQAYAARRLIEGAIVGDVCRHCTAHDIRLLRRHLELQVEAEASGDRGRFVRLLTEFHMLIASLGENRILEGFVQNLAAKTSLAVLLYDSGGPPACGIEEHAHLIDLLAAGDVEAATALMHRHLSGNQHRLPAPNGFDGAG